MKRRNNRRCLQLEHLEQKDVPSTGLPGMGTVFLSGHELGEAPLVRLRRVVGDAVVASGPAQGAVITGHAQGIELASFQWGVGRGVAQASPMGGPILAARPIEIVSLNF